ncbi:O-antigen polymerase [Vibrio sinaloensis]|uniref:O-antigen polymerase n=1 Tax=Photobacterium sp. (strain ATCC 43367) TaxID=379097 RepID=UPI002053B1D9|nr:O-antigen polymerase [Vibrio sinaloensis]UPQ88127.1 oligosaccharide repeat unit polymerase [Vibrio sinaloensis]
MFISPLKIYFSFWIFPLAIIQILDFELFVKPSVDLYVLVVGSTLLFFFMTILFQFLIKAKSSPSFTLSNNINYPVFFKATIGLFLLWSFVYIVNVVGSGGLPIYWIIVSDGRTYVDFGLPTLGGLSNLLRAFTLTCFFIIYKFGPKRSKKISLYISIFLLVTAFIFETGRGNGVVLLLHPVAIYFLTRKFTIGQLALLFLVFIAFLVFTGSIQVLRYENGIDMLFSYLKSQGIDIGDNLPLALFMPSVLYIVLPIVNTGLNLEYATFFDLNPYYSMQGLVPTIIRDFLFVEKDYGVLVNAANNVTSYFTPLVRDFGLYGGLMFSSLLLSYTSYVYRKARTGCLLNILLLPPVFMSVTLSFFSLFYTSLVVVLYPILALFTYNLIKIR